MNVDQIPDSVNTLPDPGKAITDHGGGVGRGGWGGWGVVVLEGLWFSPLGLCSGP